MSDISALMQFVDRYELEPLIERAFNELTFELRPIVQKSVAIVPARALFSSFSLPGAPAASTARAGVPT